MARQLCHCRRWGKPVTLGGWETKGETGRAWVPLLPSRACLRVLLPRKSHLLKVPPFANGVIGRRQSFQSRDFGGHSCSEVRWKLLFWIHNFMLHESWDVWQKKWCFYLSLRGQLERHHLRKRNMALKPNPPGKVKTPQPALGELGSTAGQSWGVDFLLPLAGTNK